MNMKKVATILLLLFVMTSVGTVIIKERGAGISQTGGEEMAAVSTHAADNDAEKEQATAPVKVVAYYFHGNMRCYSCRMIESLTTEAIETGFADEIKDGRVELKSVNVEESGNEHFIRDFELASRSVVVARYENGAQKEWRRLDEVWQLVRYRDTFISFIQEQTNALLKVGA